MRLILISSILFISLGAQAQFVHERIRRITVFPIKIDTDLEKDLEKPAEDAWWDIREKLTESKRFLVASKNFMQAKDVFQPRGELQPADALILGRLLDANALITIYLSGRRLNLRVYETKNGLTVWSGELELHPAVPVSKQISEATQKLLLDFISSIPYQGFVITDNLIGKTVYNEGEKKLFKADVGEGTQVTIGDSVQLIKVKADRLKPLFQDGASIEVYAEGKVIQVDRHLVTVQLTRVQEKAEVKADALVRIPDELRRLKEMYGMHEDPEKNLNFESVNPVNSLVIEKQNDIKPLVASLSWIGNIIAILLLAF